MIIVCPKCDRRYLTNDDDFKESGRQVRCSGCGHDWYEQVKTGDTEFNEPMYAEITPTEALYKRSQKKSYRRLLVLMVMGIILAALYTQRSFLHQAFPQASHFFHMVGLDKKTSNHPLVIEKLTALYEQDDPQKKMIVMGEIKNIGEETHQIPHLIIQLKGSCQEASWMTRMLNRSNEEGATCVLEEWEHVCSEARLPPGETLKFETKPREIKSTPDVINAHF